MFLTLAGCSTTDDPPTLTRLDGSVLTAPALDARIQRLVDTAGVTGLTVTVFNQDTVAYQRAFGYASAVTGDSLRVDHGFYGASLSKAVFGYLVAQLAEEGIIDLDRPLQDYLDVAIPELEFEKEWRGFHNLAGDERYRDITARMCLSHTSGLPNWRWISRTGEFQPEGELYLYFDPGTAYSYSGEGMQLLQYVVEEITGKGLEQLARERVFDPLGMEMSSYLWQDRFEGNYCHGHTTDQGVIPKDVADESAAAGSMETTPVEYARFLEHILTLSREGSPVTGRMFEPGMRIRTKRQFGPGALETTDANDDIQLSYGLGWGILQSPYGKGVFKEGHGEGFQHYSILFPEAGTGILLMSNSDNAESIFKEVLEVAIGDTFTPWAWENYLPYDHHQPTSR
ncbi:CubicO group peptidase (beta-lactamase class C family) [Lewinella marina]|nr:serine hydrolase domain-containing protein [Neolewinella marina]NJB87184.1 CubicO group peptidase (beta-lactamase class C family) [Neolewinella marina]